MIKRDKAKQVMVENVFFRFLGTGGIVVVGDVHGPCTPFIYRDTYAGFRGAGSFATQEVLEPVNNRLNFNNQVDEDVNESNVIGEAVETFRPNIYGATGR